MPEYRRFMCSESEIEEDLEEHLLASGTAICRLGKTLSLSRTEPMLIWVGFQLGALLDHPDITESQPRHWGWKMTALGEMILDIGADG